MASERELEVFHAELPRLLREGHKGQYVLIRGEQVLGVFPTQNEAIREGYERCEIHEGFLTMEITDEPKMYYLRKILAPCPSSRKT